MPIIKIREGLYKIVKKPTEFEKKFFSALDCQEYMIGQ